MNLWKCTHNRRGSSVTRTGGARPINRTAMRTALTLVLILTALSGCMTVNLSSDSAAPVMMSGVPDRDYTVVRSFEVAHRGWFTLFDLITISNPAIQKTLDAELKKSGGDAIINVAIVGQNTVVDGLIPIGMSVAGTLLGQSLAPDVYTGVTYGTALGTLAGAMLSTRTYTIKGDVIRYQE